MFVESQKENKLGKEALLDAILAKPTEAEARRNTYEETLTEPQLSPLTDASSGTAQCSHHGKFQHRIRRFSTWFNQALILRRHEDPVEASEGSFFQHLLSIP
jgi:hypothetical protein